VTWQDPVFEIEITKDWESDDLLISAVAEGRIEVAADTASLSVNVCLNNRGKTDWELDLATTECSYAGTTLRLSGARKVPAPNEIAGRAVYVLADGAPVSLADGSTGLFHIELVHGKDRRVAEVKIRLVGVETRTAPLR